MLTATFIPHDFSSNNATITPVLTPSPRSARVSPPIPRDPQTLIPRSACRIVSVTPLVTISGLPGSGTTTVGQALARALGCAYHSSGEVFRAGAEGLGLSLADFGRLAEHDEEVDRALDRQVVELMRGESMVMEGRLTGWLAYRHALASLRVWLAAPLEVRLARVLRREGGDADARRRQMETREASERVRYQRYYGYDLASHEPYALVLETEAATPDELVARIVEAARE